MWYRIFARSPIDLPPSALVEYLHAAGLPVQPHFRGDELGWLSAQLLIGNGSPVLLDRYLAEEEDLRNDLNTWAAELETMDYSPNHEPLMEHVIQTKQLITMRRPTDHSNEVLLDKLCLAICQFVAKAADGVYQIDGQGWFDPTGTLLLQEY